MEKKEEKKKMEKEKVSHMCESIGDWPLWGRCPKTIPLKDRIDVKLNETAGHSNPRY